MIDLNEFSGGHRVLLNVDAVSIESAIAASRAWPDRILVASIARRFPSVDEAIERVRLLQREGVRVSVGLGDGDAAQWARALVVALAARPDHLNQIAGVAAVSQKLLAQSAIVNALIRPTDTPDMVVLEGEPGAPVREAMPADAAIDELHASGVRSIKLFPLGGLAGAPALKVVARAAGRARMMIEPTGGIGIAELGEIVSICLGEGVPIVMPHLYGSLKDSNTGELDTDKLARAVDVLTAISG